MNQKFLDDLIARRDRYLEQNPHLIPFQKEIDRLLDNAGSHKNRMIVLGIMIESNLRKLAEQTLILKDKVGGKNDSKLG